MTDRTQYYHDYYMQNRIEIIEKHKHYRKRPNVREYHRAKAKLWRLRNKDALRVAVGLGITLTKARELIAKEKQRCTSPNTPSLT